MAFCLPRSSPRMDTNTFTTCRSLDTSTSETVTITEITLSTPMRSSGEIMLRMFCARDEGEKVSVRTNLGFWCDACRAQNGAGAYLVRLQHVGNLSTHLLLHLLHPSRVRALHTQRGDRGTRRARLRNGVRFFVPRAEGRREGGAHGGDAQGGPRCRDAPAPARGVVRRNAYAPQAEGRAAVNMLATDACRVTCPRADAGAMLLATFFGKRTRGEFAKTADLVNPRQTNYFRETPDADSRAHHFEARARGEEARPSRTDRHAFAARALLGCQRTGVRAARIFQGFANF